MSSSLKNKKLLTLKDLEECEGNAFMFASATELRQVAREWIKSLEKDLLKELKRNDKQKKEFYSNPNNFEKDGSMGYAPVHAEIRMGILNDFEKTKKPIINWIRHFFNLEDDMDG